MAKQTLATVLKKLNSEWEETEPAEIGDVSGIPEGEYKMKLEAPRVELSKASERLQIAWPMKVVEPGKMKGKTHIKFDGLDNEVSISYAKATMEILEVDIPKKMTDIPSALEEFYSSYKGELVKVVIKKTDDGYTNTYINGYDDKEADDDNDKKDKGKPKTKKYDGPSVKNIKKMSRKEIKELIKEHGLEADPDDYDDTNELRDAVVEEVEELQNND